MNSEGENSLSWFEYVEESPSMETESSEQYEITETLPPLLALFISPSLNDLYQVLSKVFPDLQFTDPSEDMDAFVKQCSKSREALTPRTSRDVVRILRLHPKRHAPHFLMWTVAEALNDPLLYFCTIIDLIEGNEETWETFASTPGSINLFLNKYLPIIGPSPRPCEATSALIRMMWLIFERNRDVMALPKKQCKIFWARLLATIRGSENSIAAIAFCAACFVFAEVSVILTKQKRHMMLFDLLLSTSHPSPLHYQAIEMIMKWDLPKFRYMTMCKSLVLQGLHNPLDLCYIERILMLPDIKKPFYGIKFLFVTATCNKIWSHAATETLLRPLERCKDMDPLIVWASIFLRRAFLFVGVCRIRKKYRVRQVLVMEMFERLLSLKIDWMTTVITGCYLGLFSRRRPPIQLPITETKNIDNCIAMEAEKMAKTFVSMKNYLRAAKIEKEDHLPPLIMPKKSKTPRERKVTVPKVNKNQPKKVAKTPFQFHRPKLTRAMSAKG